MCGPYAPPLPGVAEITVPCHAHTPGPHFPIPGNEEELSQSHF